MLCASACCAADVRSSPVGPQVDSDRTAIVEQRKLDLERDKFEFEKKKYGEELVQKQRDSDHESIKTWIAGVAVIVPLWVAIIGFWLESRKRRLEDYAQRVSREKSEELQFQLKAAEIAFDVRNSREIQPKAAALAQLFPGRLPANFAKNLDPETIRFGPPATEAKLELLKLLAQYPTQRTVILRTWGHMFPADTGKWKSSEHPNYAWFEGVLGDSSINVNADK